MKETSSRVVRNVNSDECYRKECKLFIHFLKSAFLASFWLNNDEFLKIMNFEIIKSEDKKKIHVNPAICHTPIVY